MELLLEDYGLALTGAVLALFNNFLYVFSRTAMMDIFIVAFSLWGVLAFLATLKIDNLKAGSRGALLLFSGVMFGCAMACKWNGIDELGFVLVLGAILFCARPTKNREFAQCYENLRKTGIGWFAVAFLFVPGSSTC
jgi:dolichyl-phosphate-mannose--protein O-mannosyl transferase